MVISTSELKEKIKQEIRDIDQTITIEADYENRLEEIAESVIRIMKGE